MQYDTDWWRRMFEQKKQLEMMEAKDVGLGAYNQPPQAPGYGVLAPENLPAQGQMPAGYGVLQQQQLTNTNAVNAAADGRTFNDRLGEAMSGLAVMADGMSYKPAEGMPGPPGPGRPVQAQPMPQMVVPVREETRYWLPRTRAQLEEYQRRQRGLLG